MSYENNNTAGRVRISSSALLKPATTAGFSFKRYSGDKLGDMGKKYKIPTLHTTGKKWYVEFYYLIPADLRSLHKNKVWKRFKIYEDINVIKTLENARLIRNGVEYALKELKYDPFEDQVQEESIQEPVEKEWTIQQGLNYFIQYCEGKGLEPSSVNKYKQAVNFFLSWCRSVGVLHDNIKTMTTQHIELCLKEGLSKGWSNRNYNNTKSFLSTCFIYLSSKKVKIMDSNPCEGIDKKKTLTKKHKAYNKSGLEKIVSMLKEHDPYLYFVSRIVYYLCIRSNKELKNLKIKHIDPERMQVWVMAENAKTDKDRTVPMCEEMLRIFKEQGIFKCDPEHYVVTGRSVPGPNRFGTNFLSKRFGKVRDLAGFTQDSTLYAFKHTRVIHLKLDGAPDPDIMALTGHTSFQAYSDYLRDLGMDVDPKEINKYTRAM